MGWGNCGTDSKGREIGYHHMASCDQDGFEAEIDRGLSHACGGMHGDCGGQACEGYFCGEHLFYVDHEAMGYEELTNGQLCGSCLKAAKQEIADMVCAGDLRVIDAS